MKLLRMGGIILAIINPLKAMSIVCQKIAIALIDCLIHFDLVEEKLKM
jgi:hypothetical protein